jgi:hypothetical protein
MLEALTTAAVLTGRTLQASEDELPFLLGSAARTLIRHSTSILPETREAMRLAEKISALNDVRQRMTGNLDVATTRLLGAAAALAVFGKGSLHLRTESTQHHFDVGMLPEAWKQRLAHLTAAAAAGELEYMSLDPRMNQEDSATAGFAAESAHAHLGATRVSFAEALGMETPDLHVDRLRQGRLFHAAPRGKRPARVLCRGKFGRLIRCRAVADAKGALVGYLAFDPLSREVGGRPLFAAYGLEGKREGYAWADEPSYWRAGRPEQGFTSVPESIPV